MAANIQLGAELKALGRNELIEFFNTVMEKSGDEGDRSEIMRQFEADFPALYEFVNDIDEAEKAGILSDDGPLEIIETANGQEEFGPMAYGMLLGFLTLRELSATAELRAMFEADL